MLSMEPNTVQIGGSLWMVGCLISLMSLTSCTGRESLQTNDPEVRAMREVLSRFKSCGRYRIARFDSKTSAKKLFLILQVPVRIEIISDRDPEIGARSGIPWSGRFFIGAWKWGTSWSGEPNITWSSDVLFYEFRLHENALGAMEYDLDRESQADDANVDIGDGQVWFPPASGEAWECKEFTDQLMQHDAK